MSRILVIPDLQVPFQHKYALTFLKRVRDQYKTDTVICVGDKLMHALFLSIRKTLTACRRAMSLRKHDEPSSRFTIPFRKSGSATPTISSAYISVPTRLGFHDVSSSDTENTWQPPKAGAGTTSGKKMESDSSTEIGPQGQSQVISLLTLTTPARSTDIITVRRGLVTYVKGAEPTST